MSKTSAVYARIDNELKNNAEGILRRLGISPSSAIQMLYSQIVLTKSFPIDLRLSYSKPTDINTLSQSELDSELSRGYESTKFNRTYTAEEVDNLMKEEFNI